MASTMVSSPGSRSSSAEAWAPVSRSCGSESFSGSRISLITTPIVTRTDAKATEPVLGGQARVKGLPGSEKLDSV